MATMRCYHASDAKRVYYLSMEFLTGRLLSNSLMNLGLYDAYREALSELDVALEDILEIEPDAALGNGGLGRLAACILDSMATLSLPGYGYGIRYEFRLFFQRIEDGGQGEQYADERGHLRFNWVDTEEVMALASDTPVPGYETETVNKMRLWSAKSSRDINLRYFNEGNYIKAVEDKTTSENLSKVLY